MAILLYEQFILLTKIISHPNIQFLSTQQHAYQSFLITSWFYCIPVTVTRLVNFEMNHHQLSDYKV